MTTGLLALCNSLQVGVAFNDVATADPTSFGWAAPGTVGATGQWTDLSSYVFGYETEARGRQHDLDEVEAGELTLLVDNQLAYFSPWNTSSPLYGLILPKLWVTVVANVGGTNARFTGHISGFTPVWADPLSVQCSITAYDPGRFWNAADLVSSSYFQTLLALNPVGYWRVDEASGTVAVDSSGNNQDGAYVGTVTLGATSLIPTSSDTAVNLAGTGKVAMPVGGFSNASGVQGTVLFWFSTSTTTGTQVLYDNTISGKGWSVEIVSGQLEVVDNTTGTPVATSLGTVNQFCDGNPHNIMVSQTGRAWSVVVDGSANTGEVSYAFTGGSQSLTVPAGITSIGVYLQSGTGGGAHGRNGSPNGVPTGAAGSTSRFTMAVTPGDTIGIVVGGGGLRANAITPANGAAVYPDGNAGTTTTFSTVQGSYTQYNGSGGGSTRLLHNGTIVAVAGGGGAGGYANAAPPPPGAGSAQDVGTGGTAGSAGTTTDPGSSHYGGNNGFNGGGGVGWHSSSLTSVSTGITSYPPGFSDGINGVARISGLNGGAWGAAFTGNASCTFGGLNSGTGSVFNGVVDELSVFATNLSSQAEQLYLLAQGNFVQQDTGARVAATATVINYPPSACQFDTGIVEVQTNTANLTQTSALTMAQQAEETEGGRFFFLASGVARFVNRRNQYTVAPFNASQVTFGDGAAEVHYLAGPQAPFDDIDIYNQAIVQPEGGNLYTANNTASQAVMGTVTWTPNSTPLNLTTDTTNPQERAEWVANIHAFPVTRFDELIVDMMDVVAMDGGTPGFNCAAVLSLDIGSRVTANRHTLPGGGTPFSEVMIVEQISESVSLGGDGNEAGWQITFALSGTGAIMPWISGDPVFGLSGTTTISGY